MQYGFRDLKINKDVRQEDIPREGILFGDFSSSDQGWFLLERNAPTPDEKKIVESLPYQQGQYDFSEFQSERFYENREITYKFVLPPKFYDDRKGYEQEIKRTLIRSGQQVLLDSHEIIYYWTGKCTKVEVDDDSSKNLLTATLTFSCYPYAFTNHNEGSDIWDDVFFPHWIWQDMHFEVNGKKIISFQNIGSKPVIGSFVNVKGKPSAKGVGIEFDVDLSEDNKTIQTVKIMVGENKYEVSGAGSFDLQFKREEMI